MNNCGILFLLGGKYFAILFYGSVPLEPLRTLLDTCELCAMEQFVLLFQGDIFSVKQHSFFIK